MRRCLKSSDSDKFVDYVPSSQLPNSWGESHTVYHEPGTARTFQHTLTRQGLGLDIRFAYILNLAIYRCSGDVRYSPRSRAEGAKPNRALPQSASDDLLIRMNFAAVEAVSIIIGRWYRWF